MKARSIAAVICAAAAVVALSACGDSEESSSTTGSSSKDSQTSNPPKSTAKGDPIVVGSICSCSGAQAANLARLKDVSETWAKAVNANGGINGHPVNIIVKDDGGVPAKALQAAKDLIENEKVMAIVGDNSLADAAFSKYVSSTGVPVVGGIAVEATFLTNPDFFASGASLPVATVGTMALAKQAGKKHVGVLYCSESPACAQLDPLAKGAATLAGLNYRSGKISGTAPNYTAPCLANKGAGVDALFVAHNSAVVPRVVDGCAKQGYKPLQVTQTTTAATSFLKDPNLEGTVLASTNAPHTDESLPAVKEFLDAVDTYNQGLRDSPQFSYNLIYPWVSGKLFEAAAKAAKITPTSTAADVRKGLYALKDETLGGLSGPLNYTKGKPAFPACYFSVTIKGGEFASLNGGKPTCLTAPQVKGLTAALTG